MPSPSHALLAGTDLVAVPDVAASLARFGDRYLRRVYTAAEVADCAGEPSVMASGLAARFAAKEATVKALDVATAVDWREVEVRRRPSGQPELALYAGLARRAEELGVAELAVSMAHHGDLAHAVVVGLRSSTPRQASPQQANQQQPHRPAHSKGQ